MRYEWLRCVFIIYCWIKLFVLQVEILCDREYVMKTGREITQVITLISETRVVTTLAQVQS